MKNELRLNVEKFRLNAQILRLNVTSSRGNWNNIKNIRDIELANQQTGMKKSSLENSLFLFPLLSTFVFIYNTESSLQRLRRALLSGDSDIHTLFLFSYLARVSMPIVLPLADNELFHFVQDHPQKQDINSKENFKLKEEKVVHEFMKNPIELVRVVLGEYAGKDVINVRVHFQPVDEEKWIPTKKGITLAANLIPELKEAIDKAAEEWEKNIAKEN